jgi:hypothetical protein
MKILPNNAPEPVPEPSRPERLAAVPQGDLKDQMKTLLEEFAEHAVNDMHALETKLEQSQARSADQLLKQNQTIARIIDEITDLKKAMAERLETTAPMAIQPPPPSEPPKPDPMIPEALRSITQEISKLTGEMAALRKALEEMKPVAPVHTVPEPVKIPDLHPILLDDFTGSKPSEEPEARKVAFFTKVWDYLNTVAFEIPLGRQNP